MPRTRIGRTGRVFAVEHAGVVPNLMVLSKSLAAVVGRADVMDALRTGGLGGTFGGYTLTYETHLRPWSPQSFHKVQDFVCRLDLRVGVAHVRE